MNIPIWAFGLSTEEKAKRSAKWGGVACLLAAARKMLTLILVVAYSQKSLDQAIAWLVGASIIPVTIMVAGVRLLRGNGRISGLVSITLMILDVVMSDIRTVTPQLISSVVVTAVLVILIGNGVRGAFALQRIDYRYLLRKTFE